MHYTFQVSVIENWMLSWDL